MSHENLSIKIESGQRELILAEMLLAKARKLVRNFMIAGIMVGSYGQAANLVFEHRAQNSYQKVEELKRAESELENIFGKYASLKPIIEAQELEENLNIEKKEYWNVLKPAPEFFKCPFCHHLHPKTYNFCTQTGENITAEAIRKAEEKNKHEKKRPVQLTDIKTRDGKIAKKMMRDYLQTLPPKWILPNVKSIVQSKDQHQIHYGGLKNEYALASASIKSDGAEIKYYRESEKQPLDYVINSVVHEIAHANSWNNDHVSHEECLNLLLKIAKRINAENRYRSSYVESIKEEDPLETNYNRAVEYWAEISAQYFSDPTKLSFSDFSVVDDYIRKIDPKYNWKKSFDSRLNLIQRIRQDNPLKAHNFSFAKNAIPNTQ